MSVTYLSDHAARGVARLALQYRNSEGVVGIVSAAGVQAQDLEDALFGIYAAQQLATAEDISLDYIGQLVSESRNGLSDTDYRGLIQAKILAMVGSGTREEILEIADALITSTVLTFEIQADGRADFELIINSDTGAFVTDVEARRLARILNFAKGAGIRAVIRYRNFTTDPFTYNTGPGYGTGKYWGNLDRG
jgi:hypothetical protein